MMYTDLEGDACEFNPKSTWISASLKLDLLDEEQSSMLHKLDPDEE